MENILAYKPTLHPYYCNTSNSHGYEFETWEEFAEDWDISELDTDYNYIFRFDIGENDNGKLYLEMFGVQQRKGCLFSIHIENLEESDMQNVTDFLNKHHEYTNKLWEDFNTKR